MKAVLHIVRSYFSFLPLQAWVNAAGAVLLAVGLSLILRAPDIKTAVHMTYAVAVPGAFLIVLVPLGLGGMALRFASSRNLLYLRPHGRTSMLLGTTLTLVLLAIVMTLPLWVEHHALTKFGIARLPSFGLPGGWFLAFAALGVAAWLIVFISSSSRLLIMLFPVAPALAAAVFTAELSPESGRLILEWIPMTWVVFVLWYWRVARIRRPDWVNSHGLVDSLASNPLEQLSSTEGGTPRGRASRQLLLGSESLLANIAIGAVVAIPLLIFVRSMFDKARMLDLPLLFAAPLSGVGASLGGMICRRARHLWLRAGLDRPALFRLAERAGMPVALAVFFAAAGVLLTASILARPEQAPVFVAYTAALGVLTASLFYFGLSLTRGWNAGDVLRGIGLIVLVGITDGTIKPRDGASVGILVATGLFTLLALLLRRWAMHRWRELDWRVARLPGVSRA